MNHSCLRPRCYDLVRHPAALDPDAQQEGRDGSSRSGRPADLRADLHRPLLVEHGRHGGRQPQGEAGQELRPRAPDQLPDLALRPDGQLHPGAPGAPRARRQYRQHRLELLPQHGQQREMSGLLVVNFL